MKNKMTLIALTFCGLFNSNFALAQIRSNVTPVGAMASYRPKTIGAVGQFSNLTSTYPGAGSTTTLAIDAFFGWNHVQYEFGPRFQYSNISGSTTGGNSTVSSLAIGAYGDYNLIPNTTVEKFVYGGTGLFMIGQDTAGGSTGSRMEFAFGGVGKWYFAPTSTSALRLEFVYDNTKTSFGGTSYTVSGLIGRAGLQTYF